MIVVTLTVTQGDDQGAAFRILDGEAKILGRSSKADIVLNDAGVSRKHCRVRVTQGTPYLFDLGSKNGTFLSGNTIATERALGNDDDREPGAARFAPIDRAGDVRKVERNLRNQDRVGPSGHPGVERDPSGVATHHPEH